MEDGPRRGVQMCPTPDSTLADPHQINADLQRQLAECRAERDAALAREAAVADVVQVINSSPGDLAPVFEAILEKAHSLCGAHFGGLIMRDGTRFRAVAIRGVSGPFAEMARGGFEPGRNEPTERLRRGEPFVHIPDMRRVVERVPDDPVARAAVEVEGVRTMLVVPFRKEEALLGWINAFRREVRPFADEQIALLQNF